MKETEKFYTLEFNSLLIPLQWVNNFGYLDATVLAMWFAYAEAYYDVDERNPHKEYPELSIEMMADYARDSEENIEEAIKRLKFYKFIGPNENCFFVNGPKISEYIKSGRVYTGDEEYIKFYR